MAESWARTGAVVSTAFLAGAMTGAAAARHFFPPAPSFRPAGVLSDLIIYPVKSMRGIAVTEAQCAPLGLRFGEIKDRSFLVTDNKNHFITARQQPRLVLVQPSIREGQLLLDAPGMDTIHIDIPKPTKTNEETCRIWGQDSRGIDCGRAVGEWLEKFLDRESGTIKLLYHPWETRERVPDYWNKWERFRKTDSAIFTDLVPYMLLTDSSITDLNSRLEDNITFKNFRPNFVVRDTLPYEEDSWKYIQIGDKCQFRCVRPCTRCLFTTIDPETGVAHKEPLQTLRTYRRLTDEVVRKREGDSPVFGSYMGLDVGGTIRVGEPVFAAM